MAGLQFWEKKRFILHLNCLYCAAVQRRELNVFTRYSAIKELFLLLLLLLFIYFEIPAIEKMSLDYVYKTAVAMRSGDVCQDRSQSAARPRSVLRHCLSQSQTQPCSEDLGDRCDRNHAPKMQDRGPKHSHVPMTLTVRIRRLCRSQSQQHFGGLSK